MSNWALVRAGSRREHLAYAIPFPPLGERFDRLTEQLHIITGLWTTPVGEKFDYSGTHYTVAESPALPKPAQSPHPPIIIGGGGAKRTPALAAQFAAEFNIPFAPLDMAKTQFERVTGGVGRGGTVRGLVDLFGGVRGVRRAATTRRSRGAQPRSAAKWTSCAATPRWSERPPRSRTSSAHIIEIGVQRVYLQLLDMSDLDHLEFFATEVVPQFG